MYAKECALFLPGAGALSVFGVDRWLLAVFLCTVPDGFVQRPVPDSLVQEAVKMVASPSHPLTQHTFIALCSSSTLSVLAGESDRSTCLANTCRYQHRHRHRHTHTHTHTHTLSLSLSLSLSPSLCVCRRVCVCKSVSERERVWLV